MILIFEGKKIDINPELGMRLVKAKKATFPSVEKEIKEPNKKKAEA
jgi:hypothetical protein